MTDGPRPRGPVPPDDRRPKPDTAELRGRLISGFGNPEGKVPAKAGTLHQDIDPGGTGRVHRKTTPSGNTGWVELGSGGGGARTGFRVLASAQQTVPEDTGTWLETYQTVTLDDAGGVDTAGDVGGSPATLYNATEPGWYWLHASVFWNLSSSSAADQASLAIWDVAHGAIVTQKAGQFLDFDASSTVEGPPLLDTSGMFYSDGSAIFAVLFTVRNVSLSVTPLVGGDDEYGEAFEGFLIG